MFSFLKKLLGQNSASPTVEVTGVKDGLLAFRTDDSLQFQETTVQVPTPHGTIGTKVQIQSYDPRSKEYLAKICSEDQTLESLDIDLASLARVSKVLRVSSPHLPGYMAMTEELSLSGLKLTTKGDLRPGDTLKLDIDFDDPKLNTMTIQAEVEWSAQKTHNTYQCSLRYRDMAPTTLATLGEYIRKAR